MDQLEISFPYLKKAEPEVIPPCSFVFNKFHLGDEGYKQGFLAGIILNVSAVWNKVFGHFVLINLIPAYLANSGKGL